MQSFGLTKYINNNYRNIRLKLLKTNVAILFNEICKQLLQKHQAKVTENECSHLV
jgi:hypothetical protein